MMRLRREQANYEEQITPQIDNLILIDRTSDLLTPFLTQLTYEGFIDELFNIKNSKTHSLINSFFYSAGLTCEN